MKKFGIILVALIAIVACNNDEEDPAEGGLNVQLTDAPANYEEVLIDVLEVNINISSEEEGGDWTNLEGINAGVYNLLDFTNGEDTTLVEQQLPIGKIGQMRMVLGDNNQVKIDGKYYDLETPSSQQSGLKFNIHAEIIEGLTYKMWIDFDAGKSIIEKGNGRYSLKPVIRTFTEATSGSIVGTVSPIESMPYIVAISSTNDSIGTYADKSTGNFVLAGLPEDLYKLEFNPVETYQVKTLENIEVMIGSATDVDTIKLDLF